MRIIDLSVPISTTGGEPVPPKIAYHDHAWGASRMALVPALDKRSVAKTLRNIVGGLVTGKRVRKRDFPDGAALAWETLRTDTHHGTHVDAPWHYGPTTDGRPARTIDQLPLEWFVGPGVRLDLRAVAPEATITVDDLKGALEAIGYTLRPMDVVLLWTGADELWGRPEYLEDYCGLDAEGTRWLLDQGVKVIGTDAWSLDRPPRTMGQDFIRSRDPAFLWPAHFVGREREYCQIEKLAHLGDLPAPTGYTVVCLPVSIERASAGWTRAVAIVSGGDQEVG
ncbi:MAG: cyclase family protein [Gaiellaceae bacterium]